MGGHRFWQLVLQVGRLLPPLRDLLLRVSNLSFQVAIPDRSFAQLRFQVIGFGFERVSIPVTTSATADTGGSGIVCSWPIQLWLWYSFNAIATKRKLYDAEQSLRYISKTLPRYELNKHIVAMERWTVAEFPGEKPHCCERHMRKASHCGSKQQQRSHDMITLLLLVRATYTWALFFTHIPFVVNRTFNATPTEKRITG